MAALIRNRVIADLNSIIHIGLNIFKFFIVKFIPKVVRRTANFADLASLCRGREFIITTLLFNMQLIFKATIYQKRLTVYKLYLLDPKL